MINFNDSRASFVGRKPEMSALKAALQQAGEGAGGVVLVGGEPGVGKTRLVQQFGASASAHGWRLLSGRAYEMEGTPPYIPFVEALRAYVNDVSPEKLKQVLGENWAEVALLVHEVRTQLREFNSQQPLSPQVERYWLLDGISDFLVRIAHAETRGLILVMDDLHWADKPTLLLVQHLARKVSSGPLLVVGMYRTVGIDVSPHLPDLLAELSREHLCQDLTLSALSQEESVALITNLAATSPSVQAVEAIHRESRGNPFLIEELVHHFAAEGCDFTSATEMFSQWYVPRSIRQVLMKRVSRLGTETKKMLEAAAILGDGFSFGLLERASRLDPDLLNIAVEEAMREAIICEESDKFRFAHPLFQRTLYDGISLHRRQRLHLEAAQTIEAADSGYLVSDVTKVAAHYRLAGPLVDTEKALNITIQAAEEARKLLAFEEAAAQYREAVSIIETKQLPDSTGGRRYTRLLLSLGEVQLLAGNPGEARETYWRAVAAARSDRSPDHLARAVLGFVGPTWSEAIVPGAIGLLEEVLAALGENDTTALRVEVICRLAELLWKVGQDEEGKITETQVQALARLSSSKAVLARTAMLELWMGPWPEIAPRMLSLCNEVLLPGQMGLPDSLIIEFRSMRVAALLTIGEIELANAELSQLEALPRNRRFPVGDWLVLSYQADKAALEGRFQEGEIIALQAREVAQRFNAEAAHFYYSYEANSLSVREDSGEEIEQHLRGTNCCWHYEHFFRSATTALYLRQGQLKKLRQEYEMLAADGFRRLRDGPNWGYELAILAESCATLGDVGRAGVLYEMMLPMANFNIIQPTYALGSAARYLGLLAAVTSRYELAFDHFDKALEMNQRLGAMTWTVLTQRDYARALLDRGEPSDCQKAKDFLSLALAGAMAMGLTSIEKECAGLLTSMEYFQEEATRPAKTPPPTLTERELEALLYLSKGLADKQIARLMRISVHTVERHIANAYTKIGLHNRVQATHYVLQNDLISRH